MGSGGAFLSSNAVATRWIYDTALANSQDQLVMPIIVTGTFQHPQVAPDMHGNAALAIWAGLGYAVVDRQSGNMRDRK